MIRLLFYLFIILGAVIVGLQIEHDPGYVLLSFRHWTVEMPLWFFMLALVAVFCLSYHILRFIRYLLSFSTRLNYWRARRRKYRSQTQTSLGLIELIEGHWEKAEKYLIRSVGYSETPLINYLSAARAAQALGAYDRRDNYLRLAHDSTQGSEMAVGLTQAELQLQHGQLEQALATLQHLSMRVPQHDYVLRLLKTVYVKLGDWQALLTLLPICRRAKVITDTEKLMLERDAYLASMKQFSKQQNIAGLEGMWQKIPKDLRYDETILSGYCTHLLAFGKDNIVESLIREALKYRWSTALVRLYGLAKTDQNEKQLGQAELWLKSHTEEGALLLCLGRLALRQGLWGKARNYLEHYLQLGDDPAGFALLGELLDRLGEYDTAKTIYARGLALCLNLAN